MFQLSRYHKIVFSEEVQNLLSDCIIFSLRTGKGLMIKKGLYDLIKKGDFEAFPNQTMLKLVDFEILVPEDEPEIEVLTRRANCYDLLTIVANLDDKTKNESLPSKAYFSNLEAILKRYKIHRLDLVIQDFQNNQTTSLHKYKTEYLGFLKNLKIGFSLKLVVQNQLADFLQSASKELLEKVKEVKIVLENEAALNHLDAIIALNKKNKVQILLSKEIKHPAKIIERLKANQLDFATTFLHTKDTKGWRSFLAQMASRKKSLVATKIADIKEWNENAVILDEEDVFNFYKRSLQAECRHCEFQFLCGGFIAPTAISCPSYTYNLKQIPVYE